MTDYGLRQFRQSIQVLVGLGLGRDDNYQTESSSSMYAPSAVFVFAR